MRQKWYTNTLFISGISHPNQIYEILERTIIDGYDVHERAIVDGASMDMEYLNVTITCHQGEARMTLYFLTNDNVGRDHSLWIIGELPQISFNYVTVDTRHDSVEIYSHKPGSGLSEKMVPKGLGKILLDDLETDPKDKPLVSLKPEEIVGMLKEDLFHILKEHFPNAFLPKT
jgi:hypothetical protein